MQSRCRRFPSVTIRRTSQFVANCIRWTLWPSLAATGVVLIAGRPILWLFGHEFVSGYSLLFILSFGLLARAAVGPIDELINMLGEQKTCALVYAGAFAFNLVACLALIPRFGTMGAAVSTSAALLAESIALFLVAKRKLGLISVIWAISVMRAKAHARAGTGESSSPMNEPSCEASAGYGAKTSNRPRLLQLERMRS
jgi:O-antigen/teichoic acid export membrane protein